MQKHRPTQSHATDYIRQQIKIAGIGSPVFEKTTNILRQLDSILNGPHPVDNVVPLETAKACGDTAWQPATRYFTSRKEDPNSKDLPFDRDEDPDGLLEGLRKDTHFHGEDNKVLYFASVIDDDQKK